MFSHRAPADFRPNRLAAALAELRARGVAIIDLTQSNPTLAGFEYPTALLAPLAADVSLRYEPRPFGLEPARAAAAGDYARRGIRVDPARVVLTASTSEAYSVLFKLLCDPGDEVLVPVPSYPLFEHLTWLDAVRPVAYPLEYHGRWSVDVAALERAIGPRARAVLVVNPNNPTGSFVTGSELERLAAICAARGLALIGDEVFADYAFADAQRGPGVLEQETALTFSLGGLSKSAGLPQVKLGWIALGGPTPLVTESLTRLELICDTYLSVSTPVQHAAQALLQAAAGVREQIRLRTASNLAALRDTVAALPAIEILNTEGGWYAVLRVPVTSGEEQLALELLQHDHVLAHPGYFFDFSHGAFLVVSLLPPRDEFLAGVRRLAARAGAC